MSDDRIHADWARGLLPYLALTALADRDTHGYAIAQRLTRAGLGPVKGGALYPVLKRLESEGAIAAEWEPGDGGPGRKTFRVTNEGRQRLELLATTWSQFASALRSTLGEPEHPVSDPMASSAGAL